MTSNNAASAIDQLHKEISQELWEDRNRLRGYIYSLGYREPDLSVLENETQVRYYKARLKPGLTFKHGKPWPLLVQCFRWARADFHREENKYPTPMDELPPAADDSLSEVDQVTQREAIAAFLERHLPHEGQRKAWELAFQEGKGPAEIGLALGIDRGTAADWRDKAKERLKSLPPEEWDHLR
ncbi:sigma-70 family RNA polymerase sigma factor [Streptomyces heilongjiangensis]|uniref:Sigma-70 family RNA polymerase sigma factor n=1 Tax=Streptomyces heilongjiangensis TaxID=945052 RepID=A0ABW1BHG7_9ACTN|nr:sigma-70 family RNA polymerase sigma factor [Streptomyces heilongjiangensis]MDC2951081.1 sigma-70 family RNA polymerase sigma factor [Streptomyces heilongjiangensis]